VGRLIAKNPDGGECGFDMPITTDGGLSVITEDGWINM
jgi:hypothetical protein